MNPPGAAGARIEPPEVIVRVLEAGEAKALVPALAAVLTDCVEKGASVSFMSPLSSARAEAFWNGVAEGVAREERILLAASFDGEVVGTVQVVLAQPENQPHRADISKMLVHSRARRQGIGEALMRAAEAAASEAGKSLLVLDTASDVAERLYERRGWVRVGTVPNYALFPDGRFADTVFYYKDLSKA